MLLAHCVRYITRAVSSARSCCVSNSAETPAMDVVEFTCDGVELREVGYENKALVKSGRLVIETNTSGFSLKVDDTPVELLPEAPRGAYTRSGSTFVLGTNDLMSFMYIILPHGTPDSQADRLDEVLQALQNGEPVPAPGQSEADAAVAAATGLSAERASYYEPGSQGLAADAEVFEVPPAAAAAADKAAAAQQAGAGQHAGASGAKPSNTSALFDAMGATMKAIAGKAAHDTMLLNHAIKQKMEHDTQLLEQRKQAEMGRQAQQHADPAPQH